MSWLLGERYSKQHQIISDHIQNDRSNIGAGDSVNQPPNNTKPPVQMESFGFDSTGFEQAAAATKELQKSPYAKEMMELMRLSDEAKQFEQSVVIKQFEASMEEAKLDQIQLEGEKRRREIADEVRAYQNKANYEDQLIRKRYDEQLMQQQKMFDENLRKQEESVAREEANKLKKYEYEIKTRHEYEMKKLAEEAKYKAKIDRENRDINLEKIRLDEAMRRQTILQSIETAGSTIGSGITSFIQDPMKIAKAVGGITLVAFGIYTAKGTTSIATRYIGARLGKPTLVRETSRISPIEIVRSPIETVKKLREKPGDVLSGVVLSPKLEVKLRDIAIATKNTKYNRGMYTNVLMYGPPGTGKTMFAKKLAHYSGMDYAIITGGDLAPMGRDGVTALHKIFDWASTSKKGLLLFIDEADAFLRKRSSEHISEDLRSMLNAFLYRTGEQSDKFMLVLASNTPEQFDWAVHDRLDEMIEFELPGIEERERLIRLYFDKFVLQPAAEGKGRFKVAKFDYSGLCSKMAEMTEGASGRELAKLGVAWQNAAYASEDGVLTEEIVLNKCMDIVEENKNKVHWQSEEEKHESKSIHTELPEEAQNSRAKVLSMESMPDGGKLATS